MKKNKKILAFISLLLMILLLFVFAISGEQSLFYKVNNTITRSIMLVCFILYVITFYKLLNICNKSKIINFLISLAVICIFMHISHTIRNNYEIDLIKKNNKISCGIILHKEYDRFGHQILTCEYSENGVFYKSVFGVPSVPAKGIVPRFQDKFNMSVGDTVLIRYSVEKPEIRRIYKFKPTSEEIRKYAERDTVTIKDTIIRDDNFEEKKISYYYKLSDGDIHHFIKWHETTNEGIEIVFDFANKTVLETASKFISNITTDYIKENNKDSQEINENYENE